MNEPSKAQTKPGQVRPPTTCSLTGDGLVQQQCSHNGGTKDAVTLLPQTRKKEREKKSDSHREN